LNTRRFCRLVSVGFGVEPGIAVQAQLYCRYGRHRSGDNRNIVIPLISIQLAILRRPLLPPTPPPLLSPSPTCLFLAFFIYHPYFALPCFTILPLSALNLFSTMENNSFAGIFRLSLAHGASYADVSIPTRQLPRRTELAHQTEHPRPRKSCV
jgi:hypothetical protein